GDYKVSLSGPTAPNTASTGTTAAQMASGHTVTAEFQEAVTANPDALDWTTIGDVTVLAPLTTDGSSVTYQTTMSYPDWDATPAAKHRVLFREYEVYAADDQVGVSQGKGPVQIGFPNAPYTQRLVYADSVALTV